MNSNTNIFFKPLTQAMVNENPILSGAFFISSMIYLPKYTKCSNKYMFLKDGVPHNDLGPAMIDSDLMITWYKKNGLYVPEKPSIIQYEEPGVFEGTTFIPPKNKNLITQYYRQKPMNKGHHHRLGGPAFENFFSPQENEYYLYGKEISKEEWEKHPEVLEYFGKIQLKEKMNKVFDS